MINGIYTVIDAPLSQSHYYYLKSHLSHRPGSAPLPTHTSRLICLPLRLMSALIYTHMGLHAKLAEWWRDDYQWWCQVQAGEKLSSISLSLLSLHWRCSKASQPAEPLPGCHQSSLLPRSWRSLLSSINDHTVMTCNERRIISGMY